MIRVLLIDDDLLFLEGIQFILEKRGFSVISASDGPEAFELATKHEFDVVVTDILMTKSHGAEVIMHMRKHHPRVKVIAVSGGGWASADFHLNSTRLFGADGYLKKPFLIDELIAEINRVLR